MSNSKGTNLMPLREAVFCNWQEIVIYCTRFQCAVAASVLELLNFPWFDFDGLKNHQAHKR